MSIIPPDPLQERVPRRHLHAAPEPVVLPREHVEDIFVEKSPDSRRMIADWLERRAEREATGSRDFGRGYMQAIRVLREG